MTYHSRKSAYQLSLAAMLASISIQALLLGRSCSVAESKREVSSNYMRMIGSGSRRRSWFCPTVVVLINM